VLAGVYTALCALYIAFSGYVAAEASASIEELHRIELIKGMAFVLLTGLIYFLIAYSLLSRISQQQEKIFQQEAALTTAEGRAMAGIFASSIAHDMGNLLTAVRLNLHLLGTRAQGTERGVGENLQSAVDQLSELVSRLASIGRERRGSGPSRIDLGNLVKKVTRFAGTHGRARQTRVAAVVSEPVMVEGDEALLSRMLVNLILNGAEAAGKGGRVDVRLRRNGGGEAILEVHDNGPGIPADLRTKIFDPFYTTKQHGTGLGLLSVKVAAEEHSGTVTVGDSADLGGACFRVTLPAIAAAD
jgi:two-component system sensor histidine kinase HydH